MQIYNITTKSWTAAIKPDPYLAEDSDEENVSYDYDYPSSEEDLEIVSDDNIIQIDDSGCWMDELPYDGIRHAGPPAALARYQAPAYSPHTSSEGIPTGQRVMASLLASPPAETRPVTGGPKIQPPLRANITRFPVTGGPRIPLPRRLSQWPIAKQLRAKNAQVINSLSN